MTRTRGWIGVVLLSIVAAALALLAGFGAQPGEKGGGGWPATKVAVATVQRVDAPRALPGVGELEAARQVALAAETSGRIARIAFVSGQRVEQGELLVQINDAPEQAERLRLRAQLRHAAAVLARTRQLMADKVATQEQLEGALAAHEMARGALLQIEAVIAQKAIRAPFSGVIGIRRVHEGQYLGAGDTVASLVDASTLNVNFALDERAVAQLEPGQPVQVRVDAWPERVFAATITAIDPLIGESRMVRVQAGLPNAEGLLRAGMFAGIRVRRPQPVSVLAVPETAVTYTAYGQTVFLVAANAQQALTVRRVAVKTGERWDGRVEIASGVEEGAQVVVSGQIKLSDGMTVVTVDRDALHDEGTVHVPTGTGRQAS